VISGRRVRPTRQEVEVVAIPTGLTAEETDDYLLDRFRDSIASCSSRADMRVARERFRELVDAPTLARLQPGIDEVLRQKMQRAILKRDPLANQRL